jgi:hypothetical protein
LRISQYYPTEVKLALGFRNASKAAFVAAHSPARIVGLSGCAVVIT